MIQKRITICASPQPFFSKWWWIGAIRKTRRPVRYLELPKARHGEYGPEGPRVMAEGLAWLFAPLAEAEPAAGTGQAAPSGAHVP